MNAINIYVPSRMTKGKPDLPWMTVTIKRQLREPNGAAVKHQLHGRPIRNSATKALRDPHKSYVNGVVGESL